MSAGKIGTCDWDACEDCGNFDSSVDTCGLGTPEVALDGEDVTCLEYEAVDDPGDGDE